MVDSKILSIPRNGLVGEWLLDGNAYDTNDGTKNNGTRTNVSDAQTPVGYQKQAGVFNGSSSYFIANAPDYYGSQNFSVSQWVYINTVKNSIPFCFLDSGIDNGTWEKAFWLQADGTMRFYLFDGSSQYATFSGLTTGKWYHLVGTFDGTTTRIFVNGVEGNSVSQSSSFNYGTPKIAFGSAPSGVSRFDGMIQSTRLYSYSLSDQERLALYLEGKRKLGNEGYPSLMGKMAAQFETDGGTALYNVVGGTVATYLGGSATTDDFGIAKAISNPNYTWGSITYTSAYSWENSGSGWNLAKNPTGVSATGINRTTTFRTLFLTNATLSADEETALASICASSYPYAFTKSLPSSLREGLVLDWQNGYDQSGNGNAGTEYNSPTPARRMTTKGRTFNGTSQYVLLPNITDLKKPNDYTISGWFVIPSGTSMRKAYDTGYVFLGVTDTVAQAYYYPAGNDIISVNHGRAVGSLNHFVYTKSSTSGTALYINGCRYGFETGATANASIQYQPRIASGQNAEYFLGNIYRMQMWNRPLSALEAQQLFYSTYLPS